jgi:hypothetical protein
MWPRLSQIEGNIWSKITGRRNDSASTIVSWIRVISGAVTTQGKGLVLQSNQDWSTLRGTGRGSYYGDSISSGDIGFDLDGGIVGTGSGRVLRPSPIVVGLQVKEGKDQISREATLNLKCFTLEQMEMVQSYFMEPGYSLCIEYGWSTPKSDTVALDVRAGADDVVSKASNRNLNYDNLHAARINSDGDYDSFLGFIVGGAVSSDGEAFNVTITLRGMPGLPTFMQSQHKILKLGGPTGKVKNSEGEPLTYGTNELETPATVDQTDVLRDRRFKNMFNALPTFRQTKVVQALKNTTTYADFINFDAVVNKTVSSFTNPDFWDKLGDVVTGNDPAKVEINGAAIEKDKLFSKQRYIRFSLAKDILLANGAYKNIIVGGKALSVEFSLDDVKIGAFPYIFSTKKEKLIIPGFIPDFSVYFLNSEVINQLDDGDLETGGVVYSDKDFRIYGDGEIQFTEPNALKEDGFTEDARYWGYLKNLYVNFDMFHSKITQPNKNIREILEDILNEMSSAVNGFWNFQVVERQENNRIIMTVIDENWVGKPPEVPVTFAHSGTKSVFLESNLDISIPGEMLSQLVNKRLSFSVNPDEAPLSVGTNTFFSSVKDLFVQGTTGGNNTITEAEQPKTAKEDATAKLAEAQTEYQKRFKEYNDVIAKYGPMGNDAKSKEWSNYLEESRQAYISAGGNLDPKQLKEVVDTQTLAKLSQNLAKIDVVPRVNIPTMPVVEVTQIKDHAAFLEQYRVFCFDDPAYLDKLKNDAHSAKNGGGTLSHPLPIKYRFKILGTSGLRRGDMFNIDGIPDKYRLHGLFQVTEIEQNVENMSWTTEVTGEYRQKN